ncbi:unnamed protein product [Ilex paraguariensis]|uniref:Inositol-tetrakisphosphate 1-kinase N-terminal domain-containing protein n=1 Tax=Ilex paraguariensis TaxID=185542 RepID=A0ABC8QYB0_9AQUA
MQDGYLLEIKAVGKNYMMVGYIMKPSREEDFSKRGAFPLYPTQNGLIFMPLSLELPISSQLKQVDIVLHKATDEILSVEISNSSELPNKITYSRGMQELQRYVEHQPDCCVIDPFNKVYPVLDRLIIQQILLSLEKFNIESRCKIRGPHFLKVFSPECYLIYACIDFNKLMETTLNLLMNIMFDNLI